MPTATATFQSNIALGGALPPYAPHAISVSLPTWRDNVGYEEGDKRVIDKMVSGYPRFFIPLVVQKVRAWLLPLPISFNFDVVHSSRVYANKSTHSITKNVSYYPPVKSRTNVGLISNDARRRYWGKSV